MRHEKQGIEISEIEQWEIVKKMVSLPFFLIEGGWEIRGDVCVCVCVCVCLCVCLKYFPSFPNQDSKSYPHFQKACWLPGWCGRGGD